MGLEGERKPPWCQNADLQQFLSRDDIGNQARYLLNQFIYNRMVNDGIENPPEVHELIEPDTPTGPPMQHIHEISRALRCIGDDFDNDQKLQNYLSQVKPDDPQQTFLRVARIIISSGPYTWGSVVSLFYFAYKMAIKL